MLRSIRDVVAAYDAGRSHLQRFYKAAGQTGDNQWQDWAYATGQPGTNARVGNALEFTPFIATRNNAIYLPGIDASYERRIAELVVCSTAGGASQTSCAFLLYDLVGVYPLIDGDSTDAQVMDNTQTLPRYTTGNGLVPVLVNHVAAQVTTGAGTYTYVSCDGVERTVSFGVANVGITKAAAVSDPTGLTSIGNLAMPQGNGCGGVRSVTSLQFTTPPSGLWALYLIKPLLTINNNDGLAAGPKIATEKQPLILNAAHMPRVYDGAHLGFFYLPIGGSRTVAIAGHIVFIWG